jgi:PAS domain S-box-containing protein
MTLDDRPALAEELERLRSIVSDSTEFIKRWLPDGTRTYVNETYCRYFGGTREENENSSVFDELDKKTGDARKDAISRLTPENPVRVGEYAVRSEDTITWIEWTDRGIFDSEGRLVEIHSVGRDVTDRRRALEALSASESRCRQFIEEASDAVLVLSVAGELLHLNPAGLALFGFPSLDDALGTDIVSLCVDPKCYQDMMKELAEAGVLQGREVSLLSRDGRHLTVLQSATVIRGADGEISQIRAILHDITRRRELEEHLYHSQRLEAVGKLAGGIAHDFNNLLTVIGGNAELLVADFPQGSPHRSTIEAIREAFEKAVSLTQQLLAYGRPQILMPERLNINRVAEEATQMLRRVVGEDIEMLNSLAPDLGLVWADPEQIKQVLVNLALNARDAMPQGGCLDVSTQNVSAIVNNDQVIEEGSFVGLTVTDTGDGIAEEHLNHIFEPFFTTRHLHRGAGLGLATVYGIVRQSQGQIIARNRKEGGSAFDVYLPRLRKGTSVSAPERDTGDPWATDETVLLVEDDLSVRDTMRKTLERRGYRVLEAATAADALEIYREKSIGISLVLSDIVMPRMNGYQMVDEMIQCAPPKVLFISGYSDETLARQELSMPKAYPLLRKPFSPTMLASRVREALDQARVF